MTSATIITAAIRRTLAEVNVLTADPGSLAGGPVRDPREMLEELDYRVEGGYIPPIVLTATLDPS